MLQIKVKEAVCSTKMSEHQKVDFTLQTTEDCCRLFKGLIYSNIYSAQVQFMLLGTVVNAKVESTAESTKDKAKFCPWAFRLGARDLEVLGKLFCSYKQDGFKEGESKENYWLVDIIKEKHLS